MSPSFLVFHLSSGFFCPLLFVWWFSWSSLLLQPDHIFFVPHLQTCLGHTILCTSSANNLFFTYHFHLMVHFCFVHFTLAVAGCQLGLRYSPTGHLLCKRPSLFTGPAPFTQLSDPFPIFSAILHEDHIYI